MAGGEWLNVDYVMRRENGFTLIEMMIAIAVTALLLSLAVPAVDLFVATSRQTGAINDFVSSIHVARSTAVTTNARVTVCPSQSGLDCDAASWEQGWIVFADFDNNFSVGGNEAVVASSGPVDGLSFQSGEFPNVMVYRPNGRVISASAGGNAGQFTVCDDRGDEHAKVMIVDLSGRPRVAEKMADGSTPNCG